MVSFIVIGRNEGWKLEKCFYSILKSIDYCSLPDYEIIYVDSSSSDNSIEIALSFKKIKVVKLTGDYNAAIARNIGVKETTGEILFFIDGDMEIHEDFLSYVLNRKYELCYDFISGFYYNYNYDENWELINKNRYPSQKKLKNSYFEVSNGGLVVISRHLWDMVGGMKNHMIAGEDPDIGIRLANKGIYKLRINKPMAIHHTQKYIVKPTITTLFKKRFLYGRSIVYRENIHTYQGFLSFLQKEYSVLILLITFSLLLVIQSIYLIIPYVAIQALRTVWNVRNFHILKLPYLLLKDIVIIISLFFYYPSKTRKISFEVQSN